MVTERSGGTPPLSAEIAAEIEAVAASLPALAPGSIWCGPVRLEGGLIARVVITPTGGGRGELFRDGAWVGVDNPSVAEIAFKGTVLSFEEVARNGLGPAAPDPPLP